MDKVQNKVLARAEEYKRYEKGRMQCPASIEIESSSQPDRRWEGSSGG